MTRFGFEMACRFKEACACWGANPFRDEHGFTTTSMVLSLLITLALLFTSAQVYRIQSASAEVQDVADAVALAAENQVAEFMLVARFCDAVVLSLSLTGITVTGLGIAALCTPATATVSEKLIEAGKKIIDARNGFSKRAAKALNKLQEALPYYAAACSAAVARANDTDSAGSSYVGLGLLVPSKGEKIEVEKDEKSEEAADQAEEESDDIRDNAEEAAEASEKANECKERAFQHDCGNDPYYCMYERAAKLADLSGGRNPFYESVDTWSFSVALERAQEYYAARLDSEYPADSSVEERARSALREDFYAYAREKMSDGYVHESEDSFTAYFPRLPKNTSEMRETDLYTDSIYLITEEVEPGDAELPAEGESVGEITIRREETHRIMHAYSGCPGATGERVGFGSISDMEDSDYETCPECGFTVASLGKVAAASSSIENGFEYHYNIVADEAEGYEEARKEAEEKKDEVKEDVGDLIDKLIEALKETVDKRIEPSPPGRFGSVALVVNVGSSSATGGFTSSFVSFSGSLGPRAAISAATLLDEKSDEGRTAINSLLDGLRENGGVFVGAAGIVLDAWSWMLSAYADGQSALVEGVKGGLNSLPLVGASGLGTWASETLSDAIEAVGLQPAEVDALKPVLVNSSHVAAKGEGSFAQKLVSFKQRVVANPHAATDLFSAVMTDAERAALARVSEIGDSVEIASIELLGSGGPSIPITIPIPDEVKAQGVSAIQSIFARLRSQHAETMEVRPWE